VKRNRPGAGAATGPVDCAASSKHGPALFAQPELPAGDWWTAERLLNGFPQFKVEIDGIDLHCLHVPGQGVAPLPLVLAHGWPGWVSEFSKIIPD
jgi:epoxide hydrolase-like protein